MEQQQQQEPAPHCAGVRRLAEQLKARDDALTPKERSLYTGKPAEGSVKQRWLSDGAKQQIAAWGSFVRGALDKVRWAHAQDGFPQRPEDNVRVIYPAAARARWGRAEAEAETAELLRGVLAYLAGLPDEWRAPVEDAGLAAAAAGAPPADPPDAMAGAMCAAGTSPHGDVTSPQTVPRPPPPSPSARAARPPAPAAAAEEEETHPCPIVEAIVKVVFVVFIVCPVFYGVLAAGFGGILAAVEDWEFIDGFYYMGALITQQTNPLTDASPTAVGGKIVVVVVGCIAVGFFGLLLIMLGGPIMDPLQAHCWLLRAHHNSDHALCCGLLKMLIFLVLIMPAALLSVSAAFGALLAWREDWKFIDGFWFMCAELATLQTPLTDVAPSGTDGKMVTLACSAWAVSCYAALIGLLGSPMIIPFFHLFRMRVHGFKKVADEEPHDEPNKQCTHHPHAEPIANEPFETKPGWDNTSPPEEACIAN